MNTIFERILDPFFVHPRGWRGRLGGRLMEPVHAAQERWAVQRPEVAPGTRVLAIGFGTGQGLTMAAEIVRPDGHVIGVEPSGVMRQAAAQRCAAEIAAGLVVLREGSAERTGCPDASIDVATSVNNVMLWEPSAGFAEVHRVLRPGGCLVITAHRMVLGRPAEEFVAEAVAAGFDDARITSGPRGPLKIVAHRNQN